MSADPGEAGYGFGVLADTGWREVVEVLKSHMEVSFEKDPATPKHSGRGTRNRLQSPACTVPISATFTTLGGVALFVLGAVVGATRLESAGVSTD